ncbi:formate C-acetyltransferase [Dethiosulfatibacter aminovorans DSM 17477]|uniref:Formate C-acetyltransferase n=1 Tax=Dethiosulfatibacter aminovorans DSM 17477 TaxID=1121476 RepID=A0A1M6EMU2_9FIRM|nr:pyruvate formate lyase family protein [Dethiosulfatibacter aminovorans]SHI86875.1 formate C-acetyltransferase [Dethiosulfatibacter aminovorans DSM 17477]
MSAINVGTWEEKLKKSYSKRVKDAIDLTLSTIPRIDLEHAYVEMDIINENKEEAQVIKRARTFANYLKKKTIYINPDELLVGNISKGVRYAPFVGELYVDFVDQELDDPVMDYAIREFDKLIIPDETRKELRNVIIPFFKKHSYQNLVLNELMEDYVREKTCPMVSKTPTIPNCTNLMIQTDSGHQVHNYNKVLQIGLKGIREEVLWHKEKIEKDYVLNNKQKRLDFYEAALISIDAAIDYSKRYSKLAKEQAEVEKDEKRKQELLEISRICAKVPAEPAETWHEALQSVFMIYVIMFCDVRNVSNGWGRFDQYMMPFYQKTILEDKTMSRESALELMELFLVKANQHVELYNFANTSTQMGFALATQINIGGQTRTGEDAVNEVSYLVLDAEEQVGLQHPDIGIRIYEGTDDKFIRRATEVVRLGRGKPKFFFDKKEMECLKVAYPEAPIEELRDYVATGCTESFLPHITMCHSYCSIINVPKVLELTIHNGKCALTGEQLGPQTGEPQSFKSMEQFKNAFEEQMFWWMELVAKSVTVQMNAQADHMHAPFSSILLDGPIDKGKDLIEGGCWENSFGIWYAGLAHAADSLSAVDTLVYKEKNIEWDQLLDALKNNWEGYEELRQMCMNDVEKYGNDDDYADSFAAYVMDVWCDSIEYINGKKDLLPRYGGKYVCSSIVSSSPTALGGITGALPNGRKDGEPLSDTSSPSMGADRLGPSAVILSNVKLPIHRNALGNCLNQRISPQLVETDEDINRFVSFIKSCRDLDMFEIQFNIISTDILRDAMVHPEKHKGLLVRVASYNANFTDLNEACQIDIIRRNEQTSW